MNTLVNGRIPKGQECPYRSECKYAQANTCHHEGITHPIDFSCGFARLFQLVDRNSKLQTNVPKP